MSDNWSDYDNISSSILTTKEYFRFGYMKMSIFIMVIIFIYLIFTEILKRISENEDLDHYKRIGDDEYPFTSSHLVDPNSRF